MKLTMKDKEFLESLKTLMDEKNLWVDLKTTPLPHMILRGNYGAHIESHFHMTRQGVRWRFQRLLGDIYPSAYETILAIEKALGRELRFPAMQIAKARWEQRQRAKSRGAP